MASLRNVAITAALLAVSNSPVVAYPAPVAADGWSYCLVATDLTKPRGILFDTEGGLIAVDSGVGLVHFSLKDGENDCLTVNEKKTLVADKDLNHGLALSEDGKIIYASTSDEVYSWPYNATNGSVTTSSRLTLVNNMDSGGHVSRTLLLSKKQPDMLVVSRGSDGNVDQEAAVKSSGHSQIRSFNISDFKQDSNPYDFMDGTLLGWGLRNSVGVAEHPVTGGIYSVENSVDQLRRQGRDIHANNPAEEMNFHGYLNGSTEDQGGNYGYPQCVAVWSTDNFPVVGNLTTGKQFPLESTSSNEVTILSDADCETEYVAPVLSFPAHTAPLDLIFSKDGSEAFVSFHGSWNRIEPIGYEISSFAFKDGRPSAASDSMDAATPILSNKDVSSCPNDCFRPVGLAWDSDGHLWFSSDSTGEILYLTKSGGGANSGGNSTGNGTNNQPGSQSGDNDDSAASTYLPGKSVLAVTFAAAVMGFFLA